jgi:hypothetical protein
MIIGENYIGEPVLPAPMADALLLMVYIEIVDVLRWDFVGDGYIQVNTHLKSVCNCSMFPGTQMYPLRR